MQISFVAALFARWGRPWSGSSVDSAALPGYRDIRDPPIFPCR